MCGLDFFGVDHVLFASDAPFDPEKGPMYIRDTIKIIDRLPISNEEREKNLLAQRRGSAQAMMDQRSGGMMTKLASALLLLALIAAPTVAAAQNPNPLTANAKVQFGALSGFVVRSAEKVPEGLYNFRPVAEVRTMSQLFGHVADAMFSMCSTAAGTKPPRTRH